MKLQHCFLLLTTLAACGYHPVYSGAVPEGRLTVSSAGNRVAEPDACDAAVDGARSALSAEGALGPGNDYPRLVIEVLRIDEAPRGIVVEAQDPARPVTSRGASVAVTVRGWVQAAVGGPPARDTGDIRRTATFAHRADARYDSLARREAVRAAALEAGRALARRVLGEPEPAAELL